MSATGKAGIDPIVEANRKAKGKRPWYFQDPAVERVLSITMAVAAELSVCRDRLDTLERLLQDKGVLTRAEIEAYVHDADAEAQRAARQREYIARILRIVQQEMEDRSDGADLEEVAAQLAKE